MIDLGLAKLALIGAVALIVIGPEKLPKVARMAGSLFGRAQRYLHDVKAEVGREMELDELRKMQQDIEEAATEMKSGVDREMAEVEQSMNLSSSAPYPDSALLSDAEDSSVDRKAREFRRKKSARVSAVPTWYKQQKKGRIKLLSGSARVAKYRPKSKSVQSSSFF